MAISLNSRKYRRKQAYKFIYDKILESGQKPGHNTNISLDVTSIISLAEIDDLKKGYIDPSKELVAALKTLLLHVTSEQEIEDYLIKPFISKSRSSK